MKLFAKLYAAALLVISCFFVNPAYADYCSITPQATLPFTYNGFVPTTTAMVNNQAIQIGIDTGAQRGVVTPGLVERLHLPRDPHHNTQLSGTSGHQIVPNVLIDNLTFAHVSYDHITLPVTPLTLSKTGDIPSPDDKMEGLVGADILSHYDLEFDFPNKKLTLYHVTNCTTLAPPWEGPYMSVPIFITPSHRIAVPVELDGHLVTAIFDTGANGARLAPEGALHAGVTKDMQAADPLHDGAGIGGAPYKVPTHKFQSLKIGTQNYKDISIDIVDLGSIEADMLLGEDYMKTRRFWLSYATRTLYEQQPNPLPSQGH